MDCFCSTKPLPLREEEGSRPDGWYFGDIALYSGRPASSLLHCFPSSHAELSSGNKVTSEELHAGPAFTVAEWERQDFRIANTPCFFLPYDISQLHPAATQSYAF